MDLILLSHLVHQEWYELCELSIPVLKTQFVHVSTPALEHEGVTTTHSHPSSLSPPLHSAFTLFQLLSVGVASFFAAVLLSALAFTYCHHLNRPSAESSVIHPSAPNHLNYNKQGNNTPKNEKYIPMEFKVGSLVSSCARPR